MKIACIEEVALRKGFIGRDQFIALARAQNNVYGQYMLDLLDGPFAEPGIAVGNT